MMINAIIMMIFFIVSCSNDSKSIPAIIQDELRQIMHGGAREGVVVLTDVLKDEHVYGVGALKGLDGEILI